jgi:hypothetical protein
VLCKLVFLPFLSMRLREWWWRKKGEMWMCVCVTFCVKACGSALILLFDPIESWPGTSSYVGS